MPALASLNKRHILIVEDEFYLAFDLVERLETAGAVVVGPAPTIAQAATLIADAEQLDAALLDINLRNEFVYPIAWTLLQRQIPFLFTTGYDQLVVPEDYRDVPRVNKPYDIAEVLDKLKKLMC